MFLPKMTATLWLHRFVVLTTAAVASASPSYIRQRYLQDAAATICEDGEELAKLDLLLDPIAKDTGWKLECDGVEIWNAAPGSLLGKENTWITEIACINESVTCNFKLYDASGNGLLSGGWYTLVHGARTIATYDYENSPKFLEDIVCFGPECNISTTTSNKQPLETDVEATPSSIDASGDKDIHQQNLNCSNGEELAVLEVVLDNNPLETGWKLVCDGSSYSVFDTPSGFLLDTDPSTVVIEKQCISTQATCYFTIYDSNGDGLDNDGWYSLRYGTETIVSYEIASNRPFSTETVCFGPTCDVEDSVGSSMTDGSASVKTSNNSMTRSDIFILVGVIVGVIASIILVIVAAVLVRISNREQRYDYDRSNDSVSKHATSKQIENNRIA